jgi:hypothetical protein
VNGIAGWAKQGYGYPSIVSFLGGESSLLIQTRRQFYAWNDLSGQAAYGPALCGPDLRLVPTKSRTIDSEASSTDLRVDKTLYYLLPIRPSK